LYLKTAVYNLGDSTREFMMMRVLAGGRGTGRHLIGLN
jgi:hypothetical protein